MVDNDSKYNYNVITEDVRFEWNYKKDLLNRKKHNIAFDEAVTVFLDENYLEIDDPDHSTNEERFLALGFSERCRLLIVCHCFVKDDYVIRIISARGATNSEAKQYGDITNAKRI